MLQIAFMRVCGHELLLSVISLNRLRIYPMIAFPLHINGMGFVDILGQTKTVGPLRDWYRIEEERHYETELYEQSSMSYAKTRIILFFRHYWQKNWRKESARGRNFSGYTKGDFANNRISTENHYPVVSIECVRAKQKIVICIYRNRTREILFLI